MTDLLNLDGTPPPHPPHTRAEMVAFRCPPHLIAWLNDQGDRSALLRTLVQQHRDGRWPADVHDWLLAQASCCGVPGDTDAAVVAVVRHLAVRWPHGARLHD